MPLGFLNFIATLPIKPRRNFRFAGYYCRMWRATSGFPDVILTSGNKIGCRIPDIILFFNALSVILSITLSAFLISV